MIGLYMIGIAIVFLALLATLFYALVYFGIFESIQVSTGASPFPFAGAEVAYKLAKGPPADSGALFTEVCSIVPGKTTVGLYLELEDVDPENPEAERKTRCSALRTKFNPSTDDCHFLVGVITGPSPNANLTNANKQTAIESISEADRQLLTEKGFQFTTLPASENVVYSSFPYRGIVSVVVGLRRVYPALLEYISERRLCAYPAIEVYHRDTIYYLLPLSQQDQFLSLFNPPESTEADSDQSGESSLADEEISGSSSEEANNSTSSFEEL